MADPLLLTPRYNWLITMDGVSGDEGEQVEVARGYDIGYPTLREARAAAKKKKREECFCKERPCWCLDLIYYRLVNGYWEAL